MATLTIVTLVLDNPENAAPNTMLESTLSAVRDAGMDVFSSNVTNVSVPSEEESED